MQKSNTNKTTSITNNRKRKPVIIAICVAMCLIAICSAILGLSTRAEPYANAANEATDNVLVAKGNTDNESDANDIEPGASTDNDEKEDVEQANTSTNEEITTIQDDNASQCVISENTVESADTDNNRQQESSSASILNKNMESKNNEFASIDTSAQKTQAHSSTHTHSWVEYENIIEPGRYETIDKDSTRSMLYVYDASGNLSNQFLPGNSKEAQEWADKVCGHVESVQVKNTVTNYYSPKYEYGKKCSCGEKIIEGTRGGTKTCIAGHA